MQKRVIASRVLAVAGTVVLWLVVATPIVFAVVSLASGRGFRFDYLMFGEVFPVVLAGGILLVVAAIVARRRPWAIVAVFAAAVLLLGAGLLVARLTGLATGRVEAEGLPWIATLVLIGGYDLGVVALAIAGALLVRRLFAAARGST
jgi:hypothetical protein